MIGKDEKVVWILGSGFSQSLGGPTLDGLLSKPSMERALVRFPGFDKAWNVYELYANHLRQNPNGLGLWEDPEQFLDITATAVTSKKTMSEQLMAKAMDRSTVDNVTVEEVHREASFAIAMDCSFARFSDRKWEIWEPYIHWASKLNWCDTIISFNYDTVLEVLDDDPKVVPNLGEGSVVLPWDPNSKAGDGKATVLKLHGSVYWFTEGPYGRAKYNPTIQLEEARQKGLQPLIGTPGPTKKTFRHQHFNRI